MGYYSSTTTAISEGVKPPVITFSVMVIQNIIIQQNNSHNL